VLAGIIVPVSISAAQTADPAHTGAPLATAAGVVMTEPVTIGLAVSEHGTSLVVGGSAIAFDVVSRPALMAPAVASGEAAAREFFVDRRDTAGTASSIPSGTDDPFVAAFQ